MTKIQDLPLGKETTYSNKYDKSLLIGIPRALGYEQIGLTDDVVFKGIDIWNAYEVSWLNNKGKPEVRIMQFIASADSENILESKSVKLYLNSFNGTNFNNSQEVEAIIQKDFIECANGDVSVNIDEIESFNKQELSCFQGKCLDSLDVEITDYNINPNLLITEDEIVEEELHSNLLKSNCLVTNQPDWASVYIKYKGNKIQHASLLQYIISFRNQNEFHEQCVEHIFTDITKHCKPEQLTVYAKYTRRGGLDINPYRTNQKYNIADICKLRDVRQ